MKKFTKIMLIIASIIASIGVICMVAALAMGLTTEHLVKMVQDGYFTFEAGDLKITFGDDFDNDIDVDTDIKLETGLEDGKTSVFEIEEPCHSMDIEFGAGVLDIHYAEVENIQVKQTNIDKITVNVKNDTLIISEGNEINIGIDDVEDRSLIIIVPTKMQFEEVELEIGASQADIKDIQAENISVTVGAGQANISQMTTKQFELEVGAGQATVDLLSVENLDVEAGLGQVNISLNDVQEEFNYNVECGIGRVVIGKSTYGGLGAEQSITNEGATKEIDVECGIGEVVIKFKE